MKVPQKIVLDGHTEEQTASLRGAKTLVAITTLYTCPLLIRIKGDASVRAYNLFKERELIMNMSSVAKQFLAHQGVGQGLAKYVVGGVGEFLFECRRFDGDH
jgi:hypothetical protein